MSRRIAILVCVLLGTAFVQSDRALAQRLPQQVGIRDAFMLEQPVVVSGPDVGFRILRMEGSIPVGQVVVRVNGAWVAADVAAK
jgi:hypothetical protein